jgi:hypothetical protein
MGRRSQGMALSWDDIVRLTSLEVEALTAAAGSRQIGAWWWSTIRSAATVS